MIASLTGLLGMLGCGGGSAADETDLSADGSALTRSARSAVSNGDDADDDGEVEVDDEEENDRIVCALDTDCDSDEVCRNGLCSDPPGKHDDGDDAVCEADDDDDDDDEEESDRIVCTVDRDCDSDEVCTSGLCSDP